MILNRTLDTPQEWRYDVGGSKSVNVIRVRPIKAKELCVEFWSTKPGVWICEGRRYCPPENEQKTIEDYFK